MKVIIAGSRNIRNMQLLNEAFAEHCSSYICNNLTEIVSGGAVGVDRLGELFGECNKIPITRFIPDWDTQGRKAGILRNIRMAEYADALIALWDGHSKGTANMIQEMQKRSKPVYVFVVPADCVDE